MTPADHRAKAEELLAEAEGIEAPHRRTPDTRDRLIAEAQLHATLAISGWIDESYHWTPENPAPPGIAELVGLNRPRYGKIPKPPGLDEAIKQSLRDGLTTSVTYTPVEPEEDDRWRQFREKGGKIVNADTGEVIAIADPGRPADDGGFVAKLSIPTPEREA